MKIPFEEKYLNYEEQLERLTARGLLINNLSRAEHVLSAVSYFRLSPYWYPLYADKVEKKFKKESTFETAFDIYCFDREFRRIILSELEKIEIAFRSKFIYHMTINYGPYWHKERELYFINTKFTETVLDKLFNKFSNDFKNSRHEAILNFGVKYPGTEPPSWILFEIVSMGTLSLIFKQMKKSPIKTEIAKYFGLTDTILASWIQSLTYIRNVCAHHDRVWNRIYVYSGIDLNNPKREWIDISKYRDYLDLLQKEEEDASNENEDVKEIDPSIEDVQITTNNNSFYILSMILYLLKTINPHNKLILKFHNLLNKYPNIDIRSMGFPDYYREEPLWKSDLPPNNFSTVVP